MVFTTQLAWRLSQKWIQSILLRMERAKVRPRDKMLFLVRVYLVESELIGNQFPYSVTK